MIASAHRLLPKRIQESLVASRAAARYRHHRALDPAQYPAELARWFRKRTGLELNLDDPKTFDEKLQWLKLYDSTPEKGRLSDKYLVREWVAGKIGEEHLVPLLGVWDDPADIDFAKLPDRFALKATHGCDWNVIVRDKASMDEGEVRRRFAKWLETDYAFVEAFELQYRYCEPRIIAEEYLENIAGDLHDYKFFCFGGSVELVALVRGRGTDRSEEACFDTSWNRLPCTYYHHRRLEGEVPRPQALDRAIRIAETLSQGLPHVRVDLYLTNDGEVLFGEMTFTTLSGVSNWDPPEYNRVFGDLIDLTSLPAWKEMHG